jgi:cellulose synthase/poly-beta-1,6-N-acetylglucosamine synthase-like glycosyltransferase
MLYAICLLLLLILGINTLYFSIFSAAAFLFRNKAFDNSYEVQTLDMLVVFPVYKSDAVILDSVSRFQHQVYSGRYQVVVIADDLQDETLNKLHEMGAMFFTLPPSEERNKAKAINIMLNRIMEEYDVCVIMDADNIVENDFVEKMSRYFTNGALAVQARRVAKNANNQLAQLDNFSEIINNHIFRKGQRVMGLSSSLIGSGMAFDFALFKNVMRGMDVFSGFDKELELRLLERKVKIDYAEDILVYDEKVSEATSFVNQKRRWLYAQLYFLKNNIGNAIYELRYQDNLDYANKVFQFMLLPRVLSIGLSVLMVVVTSFVSRSLAIVAVVIAATQAMALAAPLYGTIPVSQIFRATLGIPGAFVNMIIALFTSGRAAGKFLHTPHN